MGNYEYKEYRPFIDAEFKNVGTTEFPIYRSVDKSKVFIPSKCELHLYGGEALAIIGLHQDSKACADLREYFQKMNPPMIEKN